MDLPHSPAAEYALIGCVLAHADRCLPEVTEIQEHDFFDANHRSAWGAIRALAARGAAVDAITVAEELAKTGPHGLMDGGPQVWTIACLRDAPIVEQVGRYSSIVREAALLRRVISLCGEVSAQARNGADADAVLATARHGLAELETYGSTSGPVAAIDAMDATLDAILARDQRPEDHAILTGLRDFDEKIGGLKRGQLIIVAGPPGMGKTAWGVNVACYNAVERKVPTLVVSLEMDVSEVLERFLSQVTAIPGHDLATGRVAREPPQIQRLRKGAVAVSKCPLWVDDRPLRLGQILGEIRRWYAQQVTAKGHAMGLVVVDYLGLIEADKEASRNEQSRANVVAQMTRSFKLLAKGLRAPVVLLSQLNRQYTQTDRPQISQLRDSGAIEQDANAVIFPWREMPRDDMGNDMKNEPGPAEWIIGKNRNGPIGTIHCYWNAPLMRFVDAE